MSDRLVRDLAGDPAEALTSVARAAEMWGAMWQPENSGGDLVLPMVQGLRRGALHARVEIMPGPVGARLEITPRSQDLRLNRTAVLVLFMGAIGGLTVVLWPLSPRVLQLAPLGVVLAIAAWLMVVSRLRNSGVEDFLELVADLAADPSDTDSTG